MNARGAMAVDELKVEGRRALVVGAGKSGLAAARLLAREGASVTITDRRPATEMADPLSALSGEDFSWRLGEHRREDFEQAELIVVSPGVPSELPLLTEAAGRKTPVIGELELGFLFFASPIYAVTGSNGKSTTTSLAGAILRIGGANVFVGGNLGTPLCEAILCGTPWRAAVVEVSSFQLETIRDFKPKIGAFLNVSPNHLDRYPGMDAYVSAKRRLFLNQTEDDFAVLNAGDSVVLGARAHLRARAVLFGGRGATEAGVWAEEGKIWTGLSGSVRPLMALSDIPLPGGHNAENVMAATAIALLAGARDADCREATVRFRGLPHRLERVRERRGVAFYNDSKATTVEAVIRSIESFDRPVVLIAGGRSKGADFRPLATSVGHRLRAAVVIGEAKGLIADALRGAVPVADADSMDAAVRKAADLAWPGDVVVLAPACSSFDMFQNFEARGDAFKEAVSGL